jgi:hypothetical protein
MVKKRKKRRGRPRNAMLQREPNGRPSRKHYHDTATANAYREAISARVRLFGLPEKAASDQRAGSVIGRLAMQAIISESQYDAAQKYIEVRHAYLRAIGAKQDFREPLPDTEGDGDYESFCRRARSIFASMQEVITELCIEQRSPAPASALDIFITRDTYLPHLEGDLRLALNRLARYFFEGRKEAA